MYKQLYSGSIILHFTEKFNEIFDFVFSTVDQTRLSAQSGIKPFVTFCRNIMNNFSEIRESEMAKKCTKMYLYILSSTIGDNYGFTYSEQGYSTLVEENMRRKYDPNTFSFYHFLIDTTLFVLERGIQVFDTKNWKNFFHSSDTYGDFYDDYMYIKNNALYLPNPEAGDLIISDYLKKCDDTIAVGKIIIRQLTSNKATSQALSITRMVTEIESIQTRYLVTDAARAQRDSPFSILIYGTPGIGKSTITTRCFSVLAKALDLEDSTDLIYTRSPGEKHWNNFRSSCWGLLFDDIAWKNPNIAKTGDESVMDLLQVINSVSFMPEQASIEDKGATPLLSKVVIGTTNCKDLNVGLYFGTPCAALRRFPYIVTVTVNPKYRCNGSSMLDPHKMMEYYNAEGEQADAWLFLVEKIVVSGNKYSYETILENATEHVFYPWLARAALDHRKHAVHMKNVNRQSRKVCEHYVFNCSICGDKGYHIASLFEKSSQCDDTDEKEQLESIQPQSGRVANFRSLRLITNYIQFIWDLFYIHLIAFGLWLSASKRSYFRNDARTFFCDAVKDIVNDSSTSTWALCKQQGTNIRMRTKEYYRRISKRELMEMGTTMRESFYSNKTVIAALVTSLAAYGAMMKLRDKSIVPQGAVGSSPVPREHERENVYYNSGFKTVPLPQSINPRLQDTFNQAINTVSKGVFNLKIYDSFYSNSYSTVSLISLGANDYLTVAHALLGVHKGPLKCALIVSHVKQGVNRNIELFQLTSSDIYFSSDCDLCVIRLLDTPPRFYLNNLFSYVDPQEMNHPGAVITRDTNGILHQHTILKIGPGKKEDYDYAHPIHKDVKANYVLSEQPSYFLSENSFSGMCGGLVCVRTRQNGITVVGIHVAGLDKRGRCFMIPRDFINDARNGLNHVQPAPCDKIELSVPSREVTLNSELHKKDPINYIESGIGAAYGRIEGFRSSPKSMVTETMISSQVGRTMNLFTDCTAPDMRSPRPKHIALNDLFNPVSMSTDILKNCSDHFIKDIISGLKKEDYKMLHPYDMATTINGAAGVAFVDSMNFSTSMGFPYNCSKRDWLIDVPGDALMPDAKTFKPEILQQVEELRDLYSQGKRGSIIFKAHLKDEAVSAKKARIGKTRVFTGAPIAYSILVRQYFLPFVRLIQNNPFLFECAVGTNAMSTQWGKICNYITRFGTKRLVAGDFRAFDKRMSSKMILFCFRIFIKIAEYAYEHREVLKLDHWYTPTDIRVMWGIATDTAFPLIDFFGSLIQFNGGNPSGHPLTVIVNCFANSLYMRYAFHTAAVAHNMDVSQFKKFVNLLTYGDDNTMGISPKIDWFDHTVIQRELAKISVEYTMPDKVSESRPFMHLEEIDFLKRKFVYDEELDFMRAPLDEKSIAKMLNVHVTSKNVTEEEQTVDIIRSANREYWFHGKETFEVRHKQLQEIIDTNDKLKHFFQDEGKHLPGFREIKITIDKFRPAVSCESNET
jgi:hypothetical protein